MTRIKSYCTSKKRYYHKFLEKHIEELSALQQLHYASNRYAGAIHFSGNGRRRQGLCDPACMSGVNPQDCQMFSSKQLSAEELEHDFLWRTTRCLPERGRIGTFNRSYYGEVLVARVHPEILRGQGLPDELLDEKTIWRDRFTSIVNFEEHFHRNGTRIIKIFKIFLHLSKDEQRNRFPGAHR